MTKDNRDYRWIEARIPHAGTMCLLERVVDTDATRIVCATTSHRSATHPLLMNGRLSSIHAIEYAAQAMALHGACASEPRAAAIGPRVAPPHGMLASARNVVCHVGRLDDIAAELTIEAIRLSGDGALVRYEFFLRSEDRLLVEGRLTAVLDAAQLR